MQAATLPVFFRDCSILSSSFQYLSWSQEGSPSFEDRGVIRRQPRLVLPGSIVRALCWVEVHGYLRRASVQGDQVPSPLAGCGKLDCALSRLLLDNATVRWKGASPRIRPVPRENPWFNDGILNYAEVRRSIYYNDSNCKILIIQNSRYLECVESRIGLTSSVHAVARGRGY